MTHRLRIALLGIAACVLVLAATSAFNSGVAQPPKGAPPPPAEGGRYQMLVWGVKENPYLVLLDTQTGRAWCRSFAGQTAEKWEDLKTPPSQPGGRAEEKPRS